ncbi:MAG: hypothetical protein IT514_02890 [Burkholderiales bacterium]|nr:hypothetical protein [Burkholderiales bacterium]
MLICVVGQSPAVVTETLYALVVAPLKKGVKRFAPTEVKIITTAVGYEGVRSSLLPRGEASMTQADRLNGKGGEFLRLTADYPAALAIRTLTRVVKLPFAIVGAIVRAIRRT